MKMMARSVLTMESIVMGFALLLVRLDHQGSELFIGIVIAVLLLLCAGLLRSSFGWALGWVLQVAILLYGFVIPSMFFMGAIFAALWFAAIYFGKKGEAIRASLIAEREPGEK
jgi:hypothetical protein